MHTPVLLVVFLSENFQFLEVKFWGQIYGIIPAKRPSTSTQT